MSSGDDWDNSDYEGAAPAVAAPKVVPVVAKSKFADEDADDTGDVKSDWDASDDDEKPKPVAETKPAGPIRQKGITKAKIAEKEAAERAKLEALLESSKEDPMEKKRREMQMAIAADLDAASALFGDASISNGDAVAGTSNPLLAIPKPKTKNDFEELSDLLSKAIIDLHGNKPLYAHFVDHFVRNIAMPLKDLDVKKAASTLTALGNEKQRQAKEASGAGKKGGKGKAKPSLGAVAAGNAKAGVAGRGYSADLDAHDTAMDDDFDDFM